MNRAALSMHLSAPSHPFVSCDPDFPAGAELDGILQSATGRLGYHDRRTTLYQSEQQGMITAAARCEFLHNVVFAAADRQSILVKPGVLEWDVGIQERLFYFLPDTASHIGFPLPPLLPEFLHQPKH